MHIGDSAKCAQSACIGHSFEFDLGNRMLQRMLHLIIDLLIWL